MIETVTCGAKFFLSPEVTGILQKPWAFFYCPLDQ
jgi:hypothetical protein